MYPSLASVSGISSIGLLVLRMQFDRVKNNQKTQKSSSSHNCHLPGKGRIQEDYLREAVWYQGKNIAICVWAVFSHPLAKLRSSSNAQFPHLLDGTVISVVLPRISGGRAGLAFWGFLGKTSFLFKQLIDDVENEYLVVLENLRDLSQLEGISERLVWLM